MKTILACVAIAITAFGGSANTAEPIPPLPSLPSLDTVAWAGEPVSLATLRGKTVIILVYASWCPLANKWSADFLDQVKAAIRDKPLVVLAIDADKKPDADFAYLRARKFSAPNIVYGRDPLMPARLGLKSELFNYAWIGAEGGLRERGAGGSFLVSDGPKQYVLPLKLARAGNLGRFEVIDPAMSDKLKRMVWPFELGIPTPESDLKTEQRALSPQERERLDGAVGNYLDRQVVEIEALCQGQVADQLAAYELAASLATNFKSYEQTQQAKSRITELWQSPQFKREVAAKRAYDKALQQATKSPATRTRLLQGVVRQHKGTVYADRAAQDGKPPEAKRLRSIRTWPVLTDAQQEAALKRQRALLEEIRQRVPEANLRSSETKHFLFFSDMPAKLIDTLYLPYLDQMYSQLCGAFGLDAEKNLWKGKATIIAFADKANFERFEIQFFHEAQPRAQGLAHCRGDGTVLISCYAGPDPKYLATVLVHETAHGFLWRYKSSDPVPSWLNEGAAEWIAGRVVSTDRSVHHKVERAIQQMTATRSLGGDFFSAQHIRDWQYGAAASITDFLLKYPAAGSTAKSAARPVRGKTDASRYRHLMEGIKAGLPWEDALQEAYGLTPAQLAQAYGQSIGIADLQP